MSTQTFACPACGSRKAIDAPRPGEKIHCTCGMSFPASPVFAVADAGGKKLSGTGWAFAASVALLIGCAGAAAWLMTRTTAGTPDRSGGHAAAPAHGPVFTPDDPRPPPEPERPTATRPDPDTPNPPPNPPSPPTPDNPPVRPAPPPPPPPAPAETLTAVKLWDAFDLAPDAAAARFNGKVLEVSGRGRVAKNSF